jgi:hypothetical protein
MSEQITQAEAARLRLEVTDRQNKYEAEIARLRADNAVMKEALLEILDYTYGGTVAHAAAAEALAKATR